ncbi:MAG: toxic anion resistance protein [Eubacteriales bacterium]|nr:toxic anion resistance protein [Eubacteriales bacterium]
MSDEKTMNIPPLTLEPFAEPAAPTTEDQTTAAFAAESAAAAAMPTLTMPGMETAKAAAPEPAAAKEEEIKQVQVIDETNFTPEEIAQVENFAKQINVTDSNVILQYGAGAQQKLADFSEKALENVRTQDLGEVGDMLAGVVSELKTFDTDEDKGKGLFGLFKKSENKLETMKAKYNKTEANVDKICDALQDHQVRLLKDSAVLDQMYELNLVYFKELSMYILAGQKRLNEVRATDLAAAKKKAQETGAPEDAQAAKDLADYCDRFEKKLHDLTLSRMVSLQTAPQLRLIQNNNTMMVEKIQSTLVNTIPLWKNQMVIALGLEHAAQAARAQNAVTEMTNELLKKNAEKLHSATVSTAKEAERGIVDMETLRHTNAELLATFDDVLKIQAEGRQKRYEAEQEMIRMEEDLKKKMLEIR